MIKSVSYKKHILHFHSTFKIAYEEVDSAEVLIVRMEDGRGNTGFGCAAPDTEVTGESVDALLKFAKKTVTPALFKEPLELRTKYHEVIEKVTKSYPSLQSAVEEAYLSLLSKRMDIPMDVFFGGYRQSPVPIMYTLSIASEEETMKNALKKIRQGFKMLKLKVGLDVESDIHKVRLLSRKIPKGVKLVLDANQGYSFAHAKKLIRGVKGLPVALIEQPVAAEKLEELRYLTKISSVPVIADESVVSISDAVKLLKEDYVSGINVKLMKCGGPLNFISLFNLARSYGKIIMLGCMYESNISISTGAYLARALPIDYVDLDSGPLDFYDDPAKGGAVVKQGKISIDEPAYV